MGQPRGRQEDLLGQGFDGDLGGQRGVEDLAGLQHPIIHRHHVGLGGDLVAADQQPLEQVHGQGFRHGAKGLVGLLDIQKQQIELVDELGLAQGHAADPLHFFGPFQPIGPVGAGTKIDPAVIPALALLGPAVVVDRLRREEQQIAGLHIEGLVAGKDPSLALHRQIDDVALHAVLPIDDKIQHAALFDGRESGDQKRIE